MKKVAHIYAYDTTSLLPLAQFLSVDKWEIVVGTNTAKVFLENNLAFTLNDALNSNTLWLDSFLNLVKLIENTRYGEDEYITKQENILLLCITFPPIFHPKKEEIERLTVSQTIAFPYMSLIRAAAYNYQNVLLLTDPDDYKEAIVQLKTHSVSMDFRLYLVGKALNLTASYDSSLSSTILYAGKNLIFPKYYVTPYKKAYTLSQGSNPQQSAVLYTTDMEGSALAGSKKVQGPRISYNLVHDYFIAWSVISIFLKTLKAPYEVPSTDKDNYNYSTLFTPAVSKVFIIGIKHGNLIGAALGEDTIEAFGKAYSYSPSSYDRSCIGCSSIIDEKAASMLVNKSFYAIIAPDFTPNAMEILKQNAQLRLISASNIVNNTFEYISIDGGILMQSVDRTLFSSWHVVTNRRPTQVQSDALAFGTLINMKAKSDSVLILRGETVIGFSQSCPSREQALSYALEDAARYLSTNQVIADNDDTVLISDSSIVYSKSATRLKELNVRAILQEGGDDSDDKLIEYCNSSGIAMVFIGMRHIAL